jgi:aspartate/methionine/tyrosine aminotransferase
VTEPPLNPVFAARPVTVFAVMTALAREFGAINLGQGFPDEDGPAALIDIAATAMREGPNQYAPVGGTPALRAAVSAANARFYDLAYDPETEILVTAGATAALAASFLAFLQPGDEAIILPPCYDSYAPMIEAAGARAVSVPLTPPIWRIDPDRLASAITPKTRLIAINSPHNPTARVMDDEERATLAALALKHNLIVVCDEVYEHLVFDGRAHKPLALLDGMRDRVIRIGSAGKTFSMTGWRIGYISGPARLVDAVLKAHQFVAYTCPPHTQAAVAAGLAFPDSYYSDFTRGMEAKRDRAVAGLVRAGFEVLPCEGTYFVTVDLASVGRDDDWAFCREIVEKAGVAAVPISAFYPPDANPPRRFARFCFCKRPDVLDAAADRLAGYFKANTLKDRRS